MEKEKAQLTSQCQNYQVVLRQTVSIVYHVCCWMNYEIGYFTHVWIFFWIKGVNQNIIKLSPKSLTISLHLSEYEYLYQITGTSNHKEMWILVRWWIRSLVPFFRKFCHSKSTLAFSQTKLQYMTVSIQMQTWIPHCMHFHFKNINWQW